MNEEKVRIYRSLGSGKTEKLTTRCLEFAISVSQLTQYSRWSNSVN